MGSNTLTSYSGGQTISTNTVNQYRTALNEDLVPRNSSGVAADIAGGLGTSSITWNTSYIKEIVVGTAGTNFTLTGSGPDGADIQDGTITRSKLESVGQQLSTSSGSHTMASTTYADVTNLSVTITTSGRPVVLTCVADGTSIGQLVAVSSSHFTCGVIVGFVRASTTIAEQTLVQNNDATATSAFISAPSSTLFHIDPVSAGTYTYKVQVKMQDANTTQVRLQNCKLLAYEL